MLYYNGRNIMPFFILWLVIAVLCFSFFIKNDLKRLCVTKERIIGYEIDEMRTPTGQTFYDTVSVIIRKGDSIFIKDRGSYNFIPKEKPNVGTVEKAGQKSAVNSGPAAKAKK